MFIQKFYKAIKGFQFHFARGIVYGEEISKSSPHQITKISKNVWSRDQFKKYETETRSSRDQDRDRQQKAETETETLKIGLETGFETETSLETYITASDYLGDSVECFVEWESFRCLFQALTGGCFGLRALEGGVAAAIQLHEQGYRQRFREAKPEGAENPDQFIVRLRNYFTQWVKLSDVESSFEGIIELMVKEQFANSCSKELSVHLMKRKPQSLRELAAIAEQYLTAHNKKLSSRDFNANAKKNAPRSEGKISDISPTTTGSIKCFNCGKVGHRASECFSKVQERNSKRYCYRCGASVILL